MFNAQCVRCNKTIIFTRQDTFERRQKEIQSGKSKGWCRSCNASTGRKNRAKQRKELIIHTIENLPDTDECIAPPDGKQTGISRWHEEVCEYHYGKRLDGYHKRHLCEHNSCNEDFCCINPKHLEYSTASENIKDTVPKRARGKKGRFTFSS